jgi:hypothetical protein
MWERNLKQNLISNFKNAIFSTLSFFAIFDYALTIEELYQNLLFYKENKEEIALLDLEKELDTLVSQKLIQKVNGLYFVFENKSIGYVLDKRRQYYLNYQKKKKIALKWGRRLAKFPGIRFLSLVNTVGMKMPKRSSDIDFFIITDKRSLWISRFFLTLYLKIFGIRPNFKDDTDTICTSFWISEKDLNLSKIKFQYFDVYLFYWLNNVIPIYDEDNYYSSFLDHNKWVNRFLPFYNKKSNLENGNFIKLSGFSKFIKRFVELIFINKIFQNFLRSMQMKYFPEKIKNLMNKDSRVMVNDDILKMHTTDNREKYYNLYKKNLDNLLKKDEYVKKQA